VTTGGAPLTEQVTNLAASSDEEAVEKQPKGQDASGLQSDEIKYIQAISGNAYRAINPFKIDLQHADRDPNPYSPLSIATISTSLLLGSGLI
jgi:hypothetical protein